MTMEPARATARQREALHDILAIESYERIESMSYQEASQHIGWYARNWRSFPPTQRQQTFLCNWGRWKAGLNRGQASDLIAEIKERIARMTPEQVEAERREALRLAVGWAG
jgi:hypothetical protein